ncbi:MAG: hypothetical protein MUE68_00790 [Bacteroidetes bacterium]|jgi:hypothetical protein|nr:hypothetical protein [Bacteroidota bacterium]
MARIRLYDICHGRSGDKGDTANVGIIVRKPEYYDLIRERLTAEVVKAHFGEMVLGKVERFELPNLGALNFLLHKALGGGGTRSLKNDAQGKTLAAALLRMELEVPAERAAEIRTDSRKERQEHRERAD